MIMQSTKHYHTEGYQQTLKSPLSRGARPNGVKMSSYGGILKPNEGKRSPFQGARLSSEYSSEPIVGVSGVEEIGDALSKMSLYGTPMYGMEEDTIYHSMIKERVRATTEFTASHGTYHRGSRLAQLESNDDLIDQWITAFNKHTVMPDPQYEVIRAYGRMAGQDFDGDRLRDWLPLGGRLDIRV